ncbi:hypothetical protein DSECCO2_617410 [anaerobic digester metagenome]
MVFSAGLKFKLWANFSPGFTIKDSGTKANGIEKIKRKEKSSSILHLKAGMMEFLAVNYIAK